MANIRHIDVANVICVIHVHEDDGGSSKDTFISNIHFDIIDTDIHFSIHVFYEGFRVIVSNNNFILMGTGTEVRTVLSQKIPGVCGIQTIDVRRICDILLTL